MKFNSKCKIILSAGAMLLASSLQAASQQVELAVEHIYVPSGFDSNDNVQVIVAAKLPNLCYKSPQSQTTREGQSFQVVLTATYEENAGTPCAQATVPFIEKISLNSLEAGEYEVEANVNSANSLKESLHVALTTASTLNDHIYGRIDFAERVASTREVQLKGYNPSNCFQLDRIDLISNGKDTYSVLPILKQVIDRCPMKMVPFTYSFEVPNEIPTKDISTKEILLHVRTMQGDSVNTLFHNQ